MDTPVVLGSAGEPDDRAAWIHAWPAHTRLPHCARKLLDSDGQPCYTVHQVRHTHGTKMVAQRSPLRRDTGSAAAYTAV